jgi:hypothetical protein
MPSHIFQEREREEEEGFFQISGLGWYQGPEG